MSIGSNIKKFRKAGHLTQAELASKANISRSYLGDLEGGRYNPSIDTLKSIANVLHINISDIIESENTDSYIKNSGEIINPYTGSKATSREKRQLQQILDNAQALFYDDEISERDKDEFMASISDMFWEAKRMNKRDRQ